MGKTPKERKKKGELPSGNVRIQVYDYTDKSGKKHYKSFTAPTRTEARRMAEKWKVLKATNPEPKEATVGITVREMIERYIDIKSGVLSPSTRKEYDGTLRRYYSGDFGEKKVDELTKASLQVFVSDLSKNGLKPKTARNAYGLFTSAAEVFFPALDTRVTMPEKQKPQLYCPDDSDVKKLLEYIQGTELEIAVLLAAFGPLRRGEICALTSDDIEGNIVHVRKNMVTSENGWVIKYPKTTEGARDIIFPESVVQKIGQKKGRLINTNPDALTKRFRRAIRKVGTRIYRFHDLRHYAASIMHAIGVPDVYILERGGWASDHVMKTVYRNSIDSEKQKQTSNILSHFEKVSHEVSHEAENY